MQWKSATKRIRDKDWKLEIERGIEIVGDCWIKLNLEVEWNKKVEKQKEENFKTLWEPRSWRPLDTWRRMMLFVLRIINLIEDLGLGFRNLRFGVGDSYVS